MPDKQNGTPAPTKAQLAGYIRSVNKTAEGLSDDEILDKLVSKNPKIGKLVSDYSNPLLQGPVPSKNQLPLISDVKKSVFAAGQVQKPKTIEQEFLDVEELRAKSDISSENYNAPIQPGGFSQDVLKKQEKYKADALKYGKQADELFEKFKVKFNSDAGIQKLKNEAISNTAKFTAKDNLGSTYVDNAKLRSYVRSKYPASANTQFEDYLVNNIGSDIMFETKKPAIKEKVSKMAKEKNIAIPENFLDLNKEITKQAQTLSDNVGKQIIEANNQASAQIAELNNAYKATAEQIKSKYSNPEFIRQNFQTDEEFRIAYQKEIGQAFDEYSRNFSSMNSRYSSLAAKLKGDYERSMKELEVTSEKQRKDISELMKQALIDINEGDNARRFATVKVLDSMNPFAKGQTFGRSLVSGLADWTSNIATNLSMGNDWQWATDFQDFSSNISKKLSTPSVEIKSIKQLVDPTQFGLSSGKMIGQMLPAIGASVATRGALGPGFGSTLAAGTLQWFDEASQARASNYNAMIEQGLDPEEAKNRSNKTYSGYLATLPLSMIEAASMFGKFGKGSMLRKFGANVAAEIPSETLQEVIQNESDEAIVNNRQLDFGKMFDLNNVYKTGLNVAPASIVMPIPGSVVESSRENLPISQTANWVMRVASAPIQSMANNITQNGLFANIASLEAMRHSGNLSEDGLNSMKGLLNEVNSDMETGKASGLNRKQQSVYAGLMANVRNMEDAVAEIDSQDMTEDSKQKAIEIANKRVQNAREVAADYLNTKNGNYAEIVDKDGDKYIVSHDELDEMLSDGSFQDDVRAGNARVQLYYNKKAGERIGEISKSLLALNKNYNEGLRDYSQSEQNLNALRKKLGIPEQPTSSTTIDGLVGQQVVYRVNKFPTKINMKGVLAVQNGNLVLETDDGGVVKLGKYKQLVGVNPSEINIEFEPQAYAGPKMTKEEAKLPSLLAMFGGKIEPKTLAKILSDVISDAKKSDINRMVKAFDSAYQRKMQQKMINESLPKPAKKIEVVEPEIGVEYDGNEVSGMLAQVGDKSAKSFFDKIMSFSLRDFVASTIDLDDLFESSEEFRNRVEQERGEKHDRFTSEYSNTEKVPAVIIDGKVKDGLGRLARLYVNGEKIAIVFENIKTKKDATTESQGQVQEVRTESDISQRERAQEVRPQAEATQADTRNRNIRGQAITVTPAIAQITSDNMDEVYKIDGNKTQKKVLNDVKKVVAAIAGAFKITVNIHNQETFEQAVLQAGGTQQESNSRGFYMASDGSIHLNFDMVKSDTMLHEGFHPILDYLQARNPEVINRFFSELEKIPKAAPIIAQARASYSGDTNQKKEAITDFVAGIADGRIVLNPTNFQKIKAFVVNMLNKIGIGEGQTLMNIENEGDLINLAKFVTEKFRGGEEITYEDLYNYVQKNRDRASNINTRNVIQFQKDNPVFFTNIKEFANKSSFKNKVEFKKSIQNLFLSVLPSLKNRYGKDLDMESFNDTTRKYLSDFITDEARLAIKEHPEAIGWYDEKTKGALDVISVLHPEISTDNDSRAAFILPLAVMSNGNLVDTNFDLAEKQYTYFKENGRFQPDGNYGIQQSGIKKTLKLINTILDSGISMSELTKFLISKHRAGDLKIRVNGKLKSLVSGELADEMVYGAVILGPKIGNGFYMNLWGQFDQLTMDRWFMRTWGRATGSLIKIDKEAIVKAQKRLSESLKIAKANPDSLSIIKKTLGSLTKLTINELSSKIDKASMKKDIRDMMSSNPFTDEIRKAGRALSKALSGEVEAPQGGKQRKFIRDVFNDVKSRLLTEDEIDITMADLQAVLWYPEKILYESFKGGKTFEEISEDYTEDSAPDYLNAAKKTVKKQGVTDENINKALSAGRRSIVGFERGRVGEVGAGAQVSDKEITRIKQAISGTPQFQKVAPTKSKMDAAKDMVIFSDKLSDAQLEKIGKGISLWEQWFTSYGLMGKDVKVAEEYKAGYISQELYKADKAVKNVLKEIQRAKKAGIKVTDEDITRFLTGQPIQPTGLYPYTYNRNNLPIYLKRALNVMRVHIDGLTEEMILNGVISDPIEIQEFRNNKGKYLGRFYDMFINGKGLTLNNIVEKLKDVDGTVIEKARDLIRSEIEKSVRRQNKNLSISEQDAIIENKVDDILNAIVEDTANPYVKRAMKGSVNMKQLLERQDIVEPIRALMGEIKNPVSRYYATIGKMSSIVAGMKYLNEVRQIGMGNFLFEENDPNRPKGTVRITADTNKNLEPLAGLYTFPEIRDEFTNYMIGVGGETNILAKVMGTAKYMNTVGNLPTHIKNFASNIGILVNNGYIFDATNAIQFIINEPEAFERAYEELRKSGTMNNNINATELRSYFEKNNDIDKVLSNKFKPKNPIKIGRDILTDMYNLEDDIFKVIAYMIESQRYAKAKYKVQFSELSNEDKDKISKKSVEIVKSILPLYSRVPPIVKGMNKIFFLGAFMSFTAESIRISKNTALLALKELSDPDTRFIGAKRLGGIIAWNTAYGWGTTTSAAAVGSMATGAFTYWINALQQLVSDDNDENKKKMQKEKSIRRIVRDYNKASDIYLTQADGGKLIYTDIGSVNPYNFISNFLNRFDQLTRDEGEGVVKDIFRSVGFALAPFVKQDFVFTRFMAAAEALGGGRIPEDSYGKKIYRQSDTPTQKGVAIAKYLGGVFTPGMAKNLYRAKEMAKEGNQEGADAEIMSTLTLRKVVIDGNVWFYNKMAGGENPYVKDIEAYQKDYSRASYKNISNEEKEAAYIESVNNIKRVISEMALDYRAALDIGVDEGKLYESMMKAKVSEENIAAVIEAMNTDVSKMDNEFFLQRRH